VYHWWRSSLECSKSCYFSAGYNIFFHPGNSIFPKDRENAGRLRITYNVVLAVFKNAETSVEKIASVVPPAMTQLVKTSLRAQRSNPFANCLPVSQSRTGFVPRSDAFYINMLNRKTLNNTVLPL
jgi:hypothetical protein